MFKRIARNVKNTIVNAIDRVREIVKNVKARMRAILDRKSVMRDIVKGAFVIYMQMIAIYIVAIIVLFIIEFIIILISSIFKR